MSSSSNSESVAGTATACPDALERLCAKIHRRLAIPCGEPLAVAAHGSATRTMLSARDALLRGEPMSTAARTSILCAGVAVSKRVGCDVEGDNARELLHKTLTLLFGLLVLAERGEVEHDTYEATTEEMRRNRVTPKRIPRDDEHVISSWKGRTLAQSAFPDSEEGVSSSWTNALRSDSAVSRAALREARHAAGAVAMQSLAQLAAIFFRTSASAMMQTAMANATRMVSSQQSFLTLDTVSMLNQANDRQSEGLASLVTAAESEAGQAVLRDLILSFKLPCSVVGVRRTLMLPREANQAATKSHTEVLNAAHEAAMRGSEWSYASDKDVVHNVCAVLAGLAVILARTPDDIRKGDAFRGRVALPFLETAPPRADTAVLGLLPASGAWMVYKVDDAGHPHVSATKIGFGGFCEMCLLFSRTVRT